MEYSKRSERVWGHRHATGPVGVNKLFTAGPLRALATSRPLLEPPHAYQDHLGPEATQTERVGAGRCCAAGRLRAVNTCIHTDPAMS